ncbi:DNA replication ATP-dependent helicase/nuclease DNA2-like [Penaeus japonicus]|uniref:DNA replication ATP-dependent helicase/nuclease DNA2-like n=1 Tax=Penaeus japonicus TaxID=27405 RepID=UPI001C711826|nr:DNA replication ATP-dependent helicase/nuclease DNA2-like [Penaeus japonicus]
MGKVKDKISPDKNQKKISSFFSAPSLFTTVQYGTSSSGARSRLGSNKEKEKSLPSKTSKSNGGASVVQKKPAVGSIAHSSGFGTGAKKVLADEISDSSEVWSDSDPEVIESTPEAKKPSASLIKSTKIHGSPEFIPSTPQLDTTKLSVTKSLSSKLSGKLSSSLNRSSHTTINSSTLSVSNIIRPTSITMKNKSKLSRLSRKVHEMQNNSVNKTKQHILKDNNHIPDQIFGKGKRPAITGTGISPDPKRTNVPEIIIPQESVICKSNLLSKFEDQNSFTSDVESDGSFSILLPESKKENKENVLNKAESLNSDDVLKDEMGSSDFSSFIKEESCKSPLKLEGKNKTESACDSEVLDQKDIASEIMGASQGFAPDITFDEEPKKQEPSVIPETQGMFEDSMDHLFDDDLAGDFEKMSPFKQEVQQVPQVENKAIKKLLFEGLGEESFSSKGDFGRHVVSAVERNTYKGEVLLRLISVQDKSNKTCTLGGFWSQSMVSERDVVHILYTEASEDGHFTVNNTQGLIVINPDFLISGTSVVSGVFCRRKAVLNERFRGLDPGNQLMLVGSLVHQLFQEVVKKKIQSREQLEHLVRELMSQPKMLQEMYSLGVAESHIYEEMNNFIPHIHTWSQRYLGNGKVQGGKVDLKGQSKRQWSGQITEIQDIEENVWSPKFGVKGKIDMTVKTNQRGISKVVPLELKTGRSSFSAEHKGQVTLYSMMSADRRDDPRAGLLLYLRDGAMEEVPAGEREKRGLIQLRNEMIYYLKAKPELQEDGELKLPSLPEPIDSERACTKCAHLLTCSVYQKSVEEVVPEPPHSMGVLVPKTTSHLSQAHLNYFRHWCLLLHLEIGEGKRDSAIRALWCQDPKRREEGGDCLSMMVLERTVAVTEPEPGIFVHSFVRSPKYADMTNLSAVGLQAGENVVVSSETEIALSLGVIKAVQEQSVLVVLDRDLTAYPTWRKKVFSVDRCEYQNTMSINFTNLARLLSDTPQAAVLRELIVDRKPPTFKKGLGEDVVKKGKKILQMLNKTQQRAVLKTLMAEDYSLLKGFPGTGKTSTIVRLVQLMVALGYSILLTSYTHSAVDNILLKLKDLDVDFLRLGRTARIHPDILTHADETLARKFKDVASLSQFYFSKKVIATTCLGLNHVIFTKRTFDFCIIDEACQVLQVAALGPLFHAKRFVLVGDPQQLPAVVQSKQARKLGMSESLFKLLDGLGATSSLTDQYRMNGPIMKIPNGLMYNGQLRCASEELAVATVHLPHYEDCVTNKSINTWIARTLDPSLEKSVVFLDTCGMAKESQDKGNLIVNIRETSVVINLLQALIRVGLSGEEVGVITPYRAQVKLMRETVLHNITGGHRIEVNTVDQYQGRDKSVIIYSCVRSGVTQVEAGEILQDERRLNVAVTRAKHKLIMVGDMTTLNLYTPFKQLIDLLESSQIYSLKEAIEDLSWND